tara:strand:+ start:694 stop:2283 length:1590 start_codon:yes stop_codon:yes gene_type:complete
MRFWGRLGRQPYILRNENMQEPLSHVRKKPMMKNTLQLDKKLIIGVSAILMCGMAAAYYGLRNEPQLFADQVTEAPRPVRDLEFTKQHKFVKLDQEILEGLVHDVDTIHIQLFSGENVVIRINKRQPINDNDAIAYGKVEGDKDSQVILSMAGDASGGRTEAMVGTIDFSDGRSFRIDYVGDGVHKLVEIDHNAAGLICEHPEGSAGFMIGPNGEKIRLMYQRATMNGGTAVAANPAATIRRLNPTIQTVPNNSAFNQRVNLRQPRRAIKLSWISDRTEPNITFRGTTLVRPPTPTRTPTPTPTPSQSGAIDILVVYTDGAAQAKGGEAGIKALAGLAVANVNTAFQNSGISASARLAGTAKWSGRTSSGNLRSDIGALRGDAAIKALRSQNKADLVAAFVPGRASGIIGIGSMPSGPSGNKNACWSVTKVATVGVPHRTFAHEIGHNLGAGHAKDRGSSGGAESTAYGWRFTGSDGKRYRTLLSYSPGIRIPYYSNPAKSYKDKPTGTAAANNAATITKIAAKAAGYK